MSSVLRLVHFARPLLAGIALSSLGFGVVAQAKADTVAIKSFKVKNGPITEPPAQLVMWAVEATFSTLNSTVGEEITFQYPAGSGQQNQNIYVLAVFPASPYNQDTTMAPLKINPIHSNTGMFQLFVGIRPPDVKTPSATATATTPAPP